VRRHTPGGGPAIDYIDDPGATHYYGDGCDDDHGTIDDGSELIIESLTDDDGYDLIFVRRADFDNLAAAFKYDDNRLTHIVDAACTLVDNANRR
jgi:hypothetical protein